MPDFSSLLKHFRLIIILGVSAPAMRGALWIGPQYLLFAGGAYVHDLETPKTVVPPGVENLDDHLITRKSFEGAYNHDLDQR
jgi:hypothetical protein